MIKNIIFDLAGVIMNLNLERDTEALNSVGLPDFAGCIADRNISDALLPYLNGLTTEEEFLRATRPFCREDATDDEILWAMDAVLDDIPKERLTMLTELRKKFRVYLLSNIYEKAWSHALGQFEKNGYSTDECFDRVFLSYEMQMAKPNPQIFRQVFAETGINPDETAYFDDSHENIAAGKSLGLNAYLVDMNNLEGVIGRVHE